MSCGLDVQTMLVASTGHVTKETADRIEADIAANRRACGTEMFSPQLAWEYGWIWHVHKIDDAEIKAEGWPEELAALINFAHTQGVTWLRLDCDGNKIPGLPSWEW